MHKPRLLPLMTSALLAATAGLASMPAGADEIAPGADRAQSFSSTRSRAEVMSEASRVSATRSNEPAGMRVFTLPSYAAGPAGAGGTALMSRSAVRNAYLQDGERMKTAALYGEDSGSFELSRRGWGSLATPTQPRQ
ncbi:hypothetical protein [Ramlibacter sp.]|uniref:hypothetical protein n=1 Tax=Ramlibacter sp. TaxID=1917967 RepID=UPI002FC9B868